jgi:hypothetical protein
MAFTTSLKSTGCTTDINPFVLIETCDDESQDDSDAGLNIKRSTINFLCNVQKKKKKKKIIEKVSP